ncbi:polysaccharide deacetylase family protein [Flavobacterium sp. H122]|uniref:polysaccharide deacetylase family protein n=1 Tax=Flavobacterium sp. H122 TaxID=2529860 RepID=UPI0010A9CD39|nr:polysaccharide deacetylase family protein [Flavobacterium sp. H122]
MVCKLFLKYLLLIAFSVITVNQVSGQSQVAITIDDVPNTKIFQADKFQSLLLKTLDSVNIPITIFINEEKLVNTDNVAKNTRLLKNWIKRKYITVGNHTYSHSRYSEAGFESFTKDIEKGEVLTKKLSKKYGKPLKYFRFPFNDLGKDSLQHAKIQEHLLRKGYCVTPFTVESIDWMYNAVYEYYLQKNDKANAEEIGEKYVAKTIEYFNYFEAVAMQKYNRPIKHIYLCHDNALNIVFLPEIVSRLRKNNYTFISLDDALQDDVYKQKDLYYKKWGISWIYRWMKSQEERIGLMKKEPSTEDIEGLYGQLIQK